MVDGAPYEVSPDRLNDFLTKFPNATKVDEPGNISDSTMTSPSVGSSIMGSSLEGGSSEQQEIEPWQNFKNNIYNAFEMSADLGEFYTSDEGAGSSLDIATSLLYEGAFGKEKIKEWKQTDFGNWFFSGFGDRGGYVASDSNEFLKSIKSFEEEKKSQKRTMTFKEADNIGDYLSVVGGSIANVGGSVVYNLGTAGTGFFMDFASDNFITANEEKAKANNTTLDNLLKSGDHDVDGPIKIF